MKAVIIAVLLTLVCATAYAGWMRDPNGGIWIVDTSSPAKDLKPSL